MSVKSYTKENTKIALATVINNICLKFFGFFLIKT